MIGTRNEWLDDLVGLMAVVVMMRPLLVVTLLLFPVVSSAAFPPSPAKACTYFDDLFASDTRPPALDVDDVSRSSVLSCKLCFLSCVLQEIRRPVRLQLSA
jgi:hypothetical protein